MSEPRAGRDGEPQLTVIFWRDIPAQVRAKAGRERASARLPGRFMVAVDAAATRAGKTAEDDYIAEWREERRSCEINIQSEVDSESDRIVAAYPTELMKMYVKNSGWAPDVAADVSPIESP